MWWKKQLNVHDSCWKIFGQSVQSSEANSTYTFQIGRRSPPSLVDNPSSEFNRSPWHLPVWSAVSWASAMACTSESLVLPDLHSRLCSCADVCWKILARWQPSKMVSQTGHSTGCFLPWVSLASWCSPYSSISWCLSIRYLGFGDVRSMFLEVCFW